MVFKFCFVCVYSHRLCVCGCVYTDVGVHACTMMCVCVLISDSEGGNI